MPYKYDEKELRKKVEVCLDILFLRDSFLLQNDTNERTIAHKLAEYLQQELPNWNVDCEYNRKGPNVKSLEGIRECNDQRSTDRVYPDIIVHIRNTDDNLLVIEMKVDNDDICDIEKLKKL